MKAGSAAARLANLSGPQDRGGQTAFGVRRRRLSRESLAMSHDPTLLRTPLFALHEELGAKMVPFAGYAMPVQYPAGVLAEHNHTRTGAGLFDVSHMGQVVITGEGRAAALETLVPGDIQALGEG